jgi:EAL domain-containing protein (putative c-di-GMP-specific phosphodiesterase class I)
VEVRGLPLGVQARVGVALGPDHGVDADALLRRVDLATQRAWRGPVPVVLFDAADERPTPDRLALVADLRRAIDRGALELEYQPVMHLASGRVAGVEALLRWRHPDRGVLDTAEVVALAERSALIGPLTAWVLDEALRQCSAWCDAGSFLSVSVNVSAHCLADEGFADDVECAMLRHGVPAHLLEVELTESAVPGDADQARRVLGRLHRLGVNIAIDGFGTGHASLAYLQTLPVDTLKIDATFVDGVGHRPGDGTIVRAIVALGRSLGLQVVAAGVADDKAERFLLDVGCELGQGFRWARPMGPGDALAWARACDASAERDRQRQQGE